MSSEEILGHDSVRARLRAVIESGRRAGAYVFSGPEGIGKRRVAEWFAEGLGAEVYPIGVEEDAHEISIEQFRGERTSREGGLLQRLAFKSSGRLRLVIVDDADRMSDEAQNCLLKTLEEPPDRCAFLLVTAKPERLFPTILSRCQRILFTPLADEEMRRFVAAIGLDQDTSEWILALAGGCPGRARALAADAEALKERARTLLDHLALQELHAVVESVSRIRDTEEARRRARELLGVTLLALRESMRAKETGEKARPAILPPALAKRLEALDGEEVADRIRDVLDHLRAIDANANVPLTVEDALLRI